MNFCLLMGSPRPGGNTAKLCAPFVEELLENNAAVRYITLADKKIAPCRGCFACQQLSGEYGCVHHDDMYDIVESLIWSDCVVLATPIYSWYCTAEMKALLDRTYGMNKFYGAGSGTLWQGQDLALITTHGYNREYGAGPLETGVIRLCKHSRLNYRGMLSARDHNTGDGPFTSPEAQASARAFALSLLGK